MKKNINLFNILKWYRVLYSMGEFIGGYFIGLYIFGIQFNLWYFVYICVVYLALFGLIYPIVYIYNDICDVEKDKLNKERLKYKPLADGKVSLNDFLGYGIVGIGLGLIIASFAPSVFILFFGIAILFNFFYTKYLKHMFIIENFANGITHSFIRFLLGIILAVYSVVNVNISFVNFNKEQLILLKQQIENVVSSEGVLVITLIVILHYINLSICSTYKRYMEFISNKQNARSTVSRYSLSTFKKIIGTLNIIYLILFGVLLYIYFDLFILMFGIIVIVWANLPMFWKKNEKFDKILIRLFWW